MEVMLSKFFGPIDAVLAMAYMPYARIVALAFFIGTMIWVYVGLKKEYVNIERPNKHFWTDLRLWTVISMLPHLVVYFWF
jgi:hypothetical protein